MIMHSWHRWLLLAVCCLTLVGPALAGDLTQMLPADLMLLIQVKAPPLAGPGALAAQTMPDLARDLEQMDKEVEKKLGFLPARDIQTIGAYLTDEFPAPPAKFKPRHAVLYLQGAFQPEKVWTVLSELVAGYQKKKPDTSLAVADQNGRKVIRNRSVLGTFVDPGLFMVGRHEVMERLLGKPEAGFTFPPDLQAAFGDSRVFLFLDFGRAMNVLRARPRNRIPGFVFEWLRPIRTLTLFQMGEIINLQVRCEGAESAALVKKTLEVGTGNLELLVNGLQRDLDARIASGASVLQLLGSLRARKVGLAVARDFLKNLKVDQKEATVVVQFTLPPVFQAKITPGAFLGMAGAAAVHIVPRLLKMRQKHRAAMAERRQRRQRELRDSHPGAGAPGQPPGPRKERRGSPGPDTR